MFDSSGSSQLALYVIKRLPRGYMLNSEDRAWLDACDKYLNDEASPALVLEAVRKACKDPDITQRCDPYELMIDAKICAPKPEALPQKKRSRRP